MKKLKDILCMVLVIVMFTAGGGTAVFADDLVFDMEGLGITEGVENVQGRLNEPVAREEFCRLVVNMMGYQSVADMAEYTDVFEDIADSKYKNAIRFMYSLSLISGDNEKTFSPKRAITVKEGTKILVDALGYSPTVTERTLDAYYVVASSLGLPRSVNADGEVLNFQNALVMINNALDIDRMVYSYVGSQGAYKKDAGNTYRNALLYSAKNDIIKIRGVVTADVSTYLNTKRTSLDANQLEIEGKIYTFETEAPIGLVGQMVEFYVKVTEDDERVFKIAPTAKNHVYSFDSEDLVSAAQNMLRFENDKIAISQGAKYIYNNRLKPDFSVNDFNRLENFKARAIDCDGDSVYETIFVEEYIDCIVERIYESDSLVYLKAPTQFRGMKYIDLDTDDKDFYVQLLDGNGEKITFQDIKTDMVLSVAASEDSEALKVYACDKIAEGTITSHSDTHITIGGEEYRYNVDETNITIGVQARAYINFDGTVVFIDYPSESLDYAYVYALQSKGGISTELQAKLLIPGPVSVKYTETEDEDGGAATRTPKLFCRNSDIIVLNLAEKVSVNGMRVERNKLADAVLNKPVTYKLNSDGKISALDVLQPADTTSSKYYNANELTFGKTGDTAFGITQDRTRSICLPTNAAASDDDLREFVELLNGVQYNVVGYALDDSTHIVDIVVMNSEMRSGTAGITNSSSDVAMVDSVKTVSAEDGEQRIVVSMIFEKELKDYTVSNLIQDTKRFQQLKCGDLIAFSLDAFDNLNGCEVIQSADSYYDYILGEYTENEKFCGIVADVEYNTISNKKNRWIHLLHVMSADESIQTDYEVLARGSMPIFVIENQRSVRAGTIDDVRPDGRIFVLSKTDVPRAVVVDNRD